MILHNRRIMSRSSWIAIIAIAVGLTYGSIVLAGYIAVTDR